MIESFMANSLHLHCTARRPLWFNDMPISLEIHVIFSGHAEFDDEARAILPKVAQRDVRADTGRLALTAPNTHGNALLAYPEASTMTELDASTRFRQAYSDSVSTSGTKARRSPTARHQPLDLGYRQTQALSGASGLQTRLDNRFDNLQSVPFAHGQAHRWVR
ncbi:hypothetical protein BURKHO8Y_20082 [Burkholderia sp. 8Y]|nr:hypothetical protein BURKHO8Y_20082 [Burkholderia sp. 8Y]